MKKREFRVSYLVVAFVCVAPSAGSATAAITSIDANIIGENGGLDDSDGRANVSVFNDQFIIAPESTFGGTNPATITGTDPILDYAFFNGESDADGDSGTAAFTGDNSTQVPYASRAGSNLIGNLEVIKSNGLSSRRVVDLWTTNDPDVGGVFATDNPNIDGTNGTPVAGAIASQTVLEASDVNIDVDISGLASGTVYALFASNNNGGGTHDMILSASLDGTVVEQLIFNHEGGFGGVDGVGNAAANGNLGFTNNRYYAAAGINFDNISGASTLNVDLFLTGSQADGFNAAGEATSVGSVISPQGGGRGRISGFVVTGILVPEPSSVLLFGTASLVGLMQRRRSV